MTERKFIVSMESNEKSKPFWDRHFTPILAFIGAVVAAVLAISDAGVKLLVNQPPDVQIKLPLTTASIGTRLVAVAIASDPDGKLEDISYRWELLGVDLVVKEGVGKENSRAVLPTKEAGQFTVLVTVTDKRGSGKSKTADAKYEVVAQAPAPSESSPPASASTPQSGQQGQVAAVDVLSLDGPTPLDWSQRQARKIITNGHRLEINARSIDTDVVILSFDSSAAPGKPGTPGAPGINGGMQQAGAVGQPGEPGGDGTAGKSASDIIVRITGQISASLKISNDGQNGGDGGPGGQGGPGGSGGQGAPAQQGILDCRSGPGFGGAGGDGGSGGTGGHGGDGGKAGRVEVIASSRTQSARLEVTANGGAPGKPGVGGQGGVAGRGGPEGSSGGFCRPAGRAGQNGRTGTNGAPGAQGASGLGTTVSVTIGGQILRGAQSVKLP